MGFYGADAIDEWIDALKMYLANKILIRDSDYVDHQNNRREPYHMIWTYVDRLDDDLPSVNKRDYVAWYVVPYGPNAGAVVPFEITQPVMSCNNHIIKSWCEDDDAYQFYEDTRQLETGSWEEIPDFVSLRHPQGLVGYKPPKTYCGQWL